MLRRDILAGGASPFPLWLTVEPRSREEKHMSLRQEKLQKLVEIGGFADELALIAESMTDAFAVRSVGPGCRYKRAPWRALGGPDAVIGPCIQWGSGLGWPSNLARRGRCGRFAGLFAGAERDRWEARPID